MSLRISESELKDLLNTGRVKIHESYNNSLSISCGDKECPKKRGKKKNEFQSFAEARYYERYIKPLELSGLLESWSMHESFVISDEFEYQGQKFKKKIYTPDFVLRFKDGSVRIIEVKGKIIKKMQREYSLKKQLFIYKYCVPNGWIFE